MPFASPNDLSFGFSTADDIEGNVGTATLKSAIPLAILGNDWLDAGFDDVVMADTFGVVLFDEALRSSGNRKKIREK